MDADEAGELIAQWSFEEEHGYKWSERMGRFTEAAVGGTGNAGRIREDIIAAGVAGGQTRTEAREDFESSFRSSLRDLYDAEGVSDTKAISLLKQYGGRTAEEAQSDIRYWSFIRDNPDVNVEKAWVTEYYDEVASSGVDIETFVNYRNQVKAVTGSGKKVERMKVIDSLSISDAQKDALYYAEGWAKSTIHEAPWH